MPDDEYVAQFGYGLVEQPPIELQAPQADLVQNPFQEAWLALPENERSGFAMVYGGSEDPASPVPGGGCAGAVIGALEDPESGFFHD